MIKRLIVIGSILGALVGLAVYGQKSTEIYIPIGKSPGVSVKYSLVGKIDSVDRAARSVTIGGEAGKHSARITEKTKIWLDKSEMKRTNESGSLADCQIGRMCEIKFVYKDKTRTDEAEWIKIRVGDSN
jgi:hypothetical protein